MAYDTVTNRLFVPNEGGAGGKILAINLDGSGATHFTAPGAPIDEPEGVAVDPVSRTIYWENTNDSGAFVWAKLDGSAGGVLGTSGVSLKGPCCRIALDAAAGRIYFVHYPGGKGKVAYVKTDGTGGGELSLVGSTLNPSGSGLAVDPAGRVYFTAESGEIGYANTNGSGGGNVSIGAAPVNYPWGLAFDPSFGRLYWANSGNPREIAFGFAGADGVGGPLGIASAPLNAAQDPLIIKGPTGTGAPAIGRDAKAPAALTCPPGSWGADYAGSFVYQAPRTYAYQWSRNGAPVPGATASSFAATAPGQYACSVTATNQAGSASQASSAVDVAAAKLKLTVKVKKATVRAGKLAKIAIQAVNQGDLKAPGARLCVKLPKSAKGSLEAKKCASLGKLGAAKKKTAKLKVKALPSASGLYRVKIVLKGAPGKPVTAKLDVLPGK